jgi:sugar phosphate isomerase/epimerase
LLAANIDQFMEMIVKTSRDNHGMILDASHMSLTELACSIELFRPED